MADRKLWTPKVVSCLSYPFAFDTAGLVDGIDTYTPTVGDVLLNAWIEVDEAWDGVTPRADLGTFVGSATGLFSPFNGPVNLTEQCLEAAGAGVLLEGPEALASMAGWAPGKFTATNPLKLVVSQDGTAGGADPGATQGQAVLYVVVGHVSPGH